MSNLIYDELTRDEIVQELQQASKEQFGCDLVMFIQKMEDGLIPANRDEDLIVGDMKAWLKLLSDNDVIFEQAHRQSCVA